MYICFVLFMSVICCEASTLSKGSDTRAPLDPALLESQTAESDLPTKEVNQCYPPGTANLLASYTVTPQAPQHQHDCCYLVLREKQLFRPNPRPVR